MSTKIYVLQLQHEKWYVGKSDDVLARYQSHALGEGSVWTKLHPPISIESIATGTNFDEDKTTKEYMAKYGIDNVRGGSYVTIELALDQRKFLEKEITMSTDMCLLCNQPGHFYKNCPSASVTSPPFPLILLTPPPPPILPSLPKVNDSGDTSNALPLLSEPSGLKALGCTRCGRNSHSVNSCFAKTHFDGSLLSSPPSISTPELRIGALWTEEEEENLMIKLHAGMFYQDIAKDHGRTTGAIKARIKKIIQRLLASGMSLYEVSKKMSLEETEINDLLLGYQKISENHPEKKEDCIVM